MMSFNKVVLLKKIQQGDQQSFAKLYDFYFDFLASEIFFILKDKASTEEVVHDVFYTIWNNRLSLGAIENFDGYMRILARRRALNAYKANLRRQNHEFAYGLELEIDSENQEELSLQQEHYRLLDLAIEQLPPQQQRVYRLSRLQKMKYMEIASHLNISTESVKKYIKLATATIKKYLSYHKDSIVCFFLLFNIL